MFLFTEKRKDLHKLVRPNVGGASSVFSRHEEVGENNVRNSLAQSIVGYDANALYLFAVGVKCSTGPFTTFARNEKGLLLPIRHTLYVLEREYAAY